MRLPFDAHNHIHLGPSPPGAAFLKSPGGTTSADDGPSVVLSGMAVMATHPQDFEAVTGLSISLPDLYPGVRVIPCYGVHPWFLHELDGSHWALNESDVPMWLAEIESLVKDNPEATVGEIGLDGFHFRPDTRDLTSSLEKQVEAFELQMDLAARLQRPVSVHTVQCFGHLMESLSRLKKSKNGLPPKIYFHAFGGKLGTVDQIVAICCKGKGKALKVYFGFAPLCNFRSPKTSEVIRKVGIERLVLESDHEDSTLVAEDMERGVLLIAEALDETEEAIVERTTVNAFELYGLHD